MMTFDKVVRIACSTAVLALVLTVVPGCQKEGPAERAGKQVDQATEKVGQQIEKAGDSIKDAAHGGK